jgi:hypothetical protein
MKDYEPVAFPSVGNQSAGMLCMTVSENRVGLRMPVLDALDRPDRIQIHRGVGKKEGYLAIEGTEEISGSVPINYDRKRISFYNRDFAALCKEMIRKYGGGKFSKGIFFTVKGKKTSDGAVEFDFRDVMYREVTSYKGGARKTLPQGNMLPKRKSLEPPEERKIPDRRQRSRMALLLR